MADNDPKTPQDLSDFADNLLKNLQEKFQVLSDQLTQRNILLLKQRKMGSNIDELQKDVSDLMTQAGIENTEDIVLANEDGSGPFPTLVHPTLFWAWLLQTKNA
ncbi:hypothetical protein XELAEV_18033525mg [Xenopus laevis]|uniref:Uncharacterized protein n=1 Tax=Xenopus laevis TaxID=8355 RepID=A0A974CJS1_XENLA|nr:hypothetical protein XELAEV_18033525mg [Xenopus laevis]